MRRNARSLLSKTLANALEYGGCPKPGPTSQFLLECVRSGNNPATVSLERGPHRMPASTFSERIGKVNIPQFLARLNAAFQKDALAALRRWRPRKGELYALLDGHEEEYWPKRGQHRCRPHRCRDPYAQARHSDNKKSPFAHPWLLMGLTWRHGDEWITLPLRLELLSPFDHSPDRQVDQCARLLKRLRIRPKALLLDRGYDSTKVRHVAAAHKLPLGLRIALGGNQYAPRHVQLASNGQRISVPSLLEAVAGDATLPVEAWKDGRSGKNVVERRRSVLAKIRPDEEAVELTVVAALKRGPGPISRWILDSEHCMLLVSPARTSLRESIRRYRLRWNVEQLFNSWSQDRPQPRSKTIQAHVVLFGAYAARMSMGALLRIADRIRLLLDPARAIPVARITSRVASRWVLDQG